jgi:membrane protein involved in colicin uptake
MPWSIASHGDVKADCELVKQIGTKRAWEAFLGRYSTGFYAVLAGAQIEALNNQPVDRTPPNQNASQNAVQNPAPSGTLAALPSQQAAPSREGASKEAIEWDKVKDSTEPADLQKFIKRFSDSPLALNAQARIDVLKKAVQERENQARAAREAEAAEKAKATAVELAAQKKREEDERRAAAAEAERRTKAAEAERKAQEVKQKAEQVEKDKAAAAARLAAEKQAQEADAARKKAELAAAGEAACKDEQGKLEAILAKGSEGAGINDLKSFSRTVTCEGAGGRCNPRPVQRRGRQAGGDAAQLVRTGSLRADRAGPAGLPDQQGRRHAEFADQG